MALRETSVMNMNKPPGRTRHVASQQPDCAADVSPGEGRERSSAGRGTTCAVCRWRVTIQRMRSVSVAPSSEAQVEGETHMRSGGLFALLLRPSPWAALRRAARLNERGSYETRASTSSSSPIGTMACSATPHSGVELIHQARTATNGDVRLMPTPGQWDEIGARGPQGGSATDVIETRLRYADHDFDYTIRSEPRGDGVVTA
jgi:hypothetical protein